MYIYILHIYNNLIDWGGCCYEHILQTCKVTRISSLFIVSEMCCILPLNFLLGDISLISNSWSSSHESFII